MLKCNISVCPMMPVVEVRADKNVRKTFCIWYFALVVMSELVANSGTKNLMLKKTKRQFQN